MTSTKSHNGELGTRRYLAVSPLILLVNTLSVLSFCRRPRCQVAAGALVLLRRQLLALTVKKLEPAPVVVGQEFRAQQIEGFSNHLLIWSAPTFPSLTASRQNILERVPADNERRSISECEWASQFLVFNVCGAHFPPQEWMRIRLASHHLPYKIFHNIH